MCSVPDVLWAENVRVGAAAARIPGRPPSPGPSPVPPPAPALPPASRGGILHPGLRPQHRTAASAGAVPGKGARGSPAQQTQEGLRRQHPLSRERDPPCHGLAVHPKPCRPPQLTGPAARPKPGGAEPPAAPGRWVLPGAPRGAAGRAGRARRAVSHGGTMPPRPPVSFGLGARVGLRLPGLALALALRAQDVGAGLCAGPHRAGGARGACGCAFPGRLRPGDG